jgi:hypothetical protein
MSCGQNLEARMEPSNGVGAGNFAPRPLIQTTYGKLLPNGTVIDLVATGDQLELLISDGKQKPFIAPQFECDGVVYQSPTLDVSVREGVTFPRGVALYGDPWQLFLNLSNLCRKHLRLLEEMAANLAFWVLLDWIADQLLVLPTLCVVAPTGYQACNFFRLLKCLCRRALRVAKLSHKLPIDCGPTLLISDPNLRPRDCLFWDAVSYSGVFVPGGNGTISQLACAKAVLLQRGSSPSMWGEQTMLCAIPLGGAPQLSDAVLANIETAFQPELQMFRLDWFHGSVDGFVPKSEVEDPPKLGGASNLLAYLRGEPKIAETLIPQLEAQQQKLSQLRSLDPNAASVEALWIPSHETPRMSITEITRMVNSILGTRGEKYVYNQRETGWRLKYLKLRTRSNGKHKELRFTPEVRLRIHELASAFELPAVPGCLYCKQPKVNNEKGVK